MPPAQLPEKAALEENKKDGNLWCFLAGRTRAARSLEQVPWEARKGQLPPADEVSGWS